MSSVVIGGVVPNTPVGTEAIVTNDGFFPDVDPARLRRERRIRDQVTPDRLRATILGAIITVGIQLARWQATQIAAGYARLADVPAPQIDGRSRFEILYERALGAAVKADLVEGYRDTDLTGAGDRKAEDLEPSIGELRRDTIHAIRDILGTGRTSIELI